MFRTTAHATTSIGTPAWVERTAGALSAKERFRLIRPLAAAHAVNATGRLAMLLGVNSGRRSPIPVTAGRSRTRP